MKRSLQILALCAAALLAVRMMAQDNGGGAGGGGGSGASEGSGGSTGAGASGMGGENSNGTTGGATGDQNGNGTTPGTGNLFGPGTGAQGQSPGPGGGSTIVPTPTPAASATPGAGVALPWMTPTPTPSPNPFNAAGQGAAQPTPVTISMPADYGGNAPKSFTLGQGRLAKPPITFSLSVTQGYDDNIFSATPNLAPSPTPVPRPTPPLEYRIIGFRETAPLPPVPIFQAFRPRAVPTPRVTVVPQLGVIGSAVSTASLGIQVQKGTPRTVVTMDLNGAEQIYWQRPGGKENYTGSFDMSFVHRLTPRATLSVDVNAVYQQTPNFALINAPTNNGNNGGGSYLNGNAIVNLTYQWGSRISSVTTYNMAMNLLESNSSGNLYSNTFGQQFRYTVSARNTATVEVRESTTQYPSEPSANSSGTFLLLGLDSILSARLTNHLNFGLESDSYTSGNSGQTIPYMESATTLALPRGSALQWTNRYGSENTGSPFITESSYRTTLSYSQPLSTKLLATVSLAYNYLQATDTQTAAGSYKQNQLQTSLNLGYTITPRFSLNLSYTYNDLISTQVNSSYQRDQTFLGGTYLFQ